MLKNRPYVFLHNYITGHPRYERVKYWTKLVTITSFAQMLVQAVGFVSGILIIRLLPVEQYALYTLANAMLGTMTILSDGGISTGVMAQSGKMWQDKQKLGSILATGLDLRKKFAGFSLLVSLPILVYLLLLHGANWITIILITASLIPAFYAALSDNLLQIPIKLHQAITPLQRNQVGVSVGRLVLTGITLFAFPWAFVAIIASGFPRILGNVRLRKISEGFADKEQVVDLEERKAILKVVKRILPGSIYFAFTGQITIWLISVFGNTTSVAQLGALGRISTLLSLLSIIFATLIAPRYTRLPNIQSVLTTYFIRIFISFIIVCILIISIAYIFSTPILSVLGQYYSGLDFELVLVLCGACLSVLYGAIFTLYSGRGWVLHPVLSISISICSLIIGVYLFDVSTLIGVLYMTIFINVILTLRELLYMIYKLRIITI